MTLKNKKPDDLKFKSLEEERAYWEERGPLAKGARGKLIKPSSSRKLESFLSIRLSGKELTELRDLAQQCGLGPSTFARELLLAVLHSLKAPKPDSHKKQIAIDALTSEICKSLDAKMPEDFKNKFVDLMKSSVIGDVDKPSLLIFDPSQMKELEEISAKIVAMLVESANPNIKIVTPYDQKYDQVRSLLEMKENNEKVPSK